MYLIKTCKIVAISVGIKYLMLVTTVEPRLSDPIGADGNWILQKIG